MRVKITYETTLPTYTVLEGHKEFKDSVIFEIPHNKDINEEADRYLAQYFTKANFKKIGLEILTKD